MVEKGNEKEEDAVKTKFTCNDTISFGAGSTTMSDGNSTIPHLKRSHNTGINFIIDPTTTSLLSENHFFFRGSHKAKITHRRRWNR